MPEEEVTVGKLCDVKNWKIHEDYFSMAIVKKNLLSKDVKVKHDE